jgi:putative FmdB family regulatory protein
MPYYSFECDKCGHKDDLEFGMNDLKEADCPECDAPMRRVFTVPHTKVWAVDYTQMDGDREFIDVFGEGDDDA